MTDLTIDTIGKTGLVNIQFSKDGVAVYVKGATTDAVASLTWQQWGTLYRALTGSTSARYGIRMQKDD